MRLLIWIICVVTGAIILPSYAVKITEALNGPSGTGGFLIGMFFGMLAWVLCDIYDNVILPHGRD